ncbi:hypothetical protein C0Q70_12307 [Pomacea canaliculata]|uniref:Ig-like domain-containing protein n=1 Tax=Pomacea canaliculata TaxID=400727 RepID=A0A2T7P157_POMCA|nr:hypothetical protein C0Q70_12307 [Pomacea canaliculata]
MLSQSPCSLCASGLATHASVLISPCGTDGVREVLADQDTVFTCTAQGEVDWRVLRYGATSSTSFAICNDTCHQFYNYSNLFMAKIVNPFQTSSMTITAANRSRIDMLINSTLECVSSVHSDPYRCELNYVYPAEGVSCSLFNTSWSVTVSCDINFVYSSRRRYTCQLYRLKKGSQNETLKSVTMVTSPTRQVITKGEVKVSGVCMFNTTLPSEEGRYGFFVIVSPGGQSYEAKSSNGSKWIKSEQPHSPTIFCGPQPYVLENTNVTCTCTTTSLGQPKGLLRWVTSNQIKPTTSAWLEDKNIRPQVLHHNCVLTLSDHGKTWFRCDIIRGEKETHGENYTASVGYAAKPIQFLLNSFHQNQTVSNGDQVNFSCESDGRPAPNVTIYSNDNNSVIVKGLSIINYTFTARCEDTATYTCSAWNEFSRQSGVTTSVSLDLNVWCKPQGLSSTHLGEYIVNQRTEMTFLIIINPVPHMYRVWSARSSDIFNKSIDEEIEGFINISCKADKVHRYLSTCTLTVFNETSLSPGSYKVQIINKAGDENFTVILTFSVTRNMESINLAVPVGAVCAILFISAIVVLVVSWNRRKNKGPSVRSNRIPPPLRLHVEEAEVNVGISQPEPCQTPLYAVVDKTKKKANSRPEHINETGKQTEKSEKREVSDPGFPPACEVVYAVVDKTRSRYPAKDQFSEESRYNDSDLVQYQNTIYAPPAQDQDGGKWDVRTSAPRCHTVEDGKWLNSAGLLYTFPHFDLSSDLRCHPPPTQDETEYCTLHLI